MITGVRKRNLRNVLRPDVVRALPAWSLRTALVPPRVHVSGPAVVFLLSFALYVTVGAVLVFAHHSIVGDSWSRVANAYYVLYSRDPHLAAIGFVWNPLPSLAVLPLLPLKEVWPALVSEGFAANLVSAAFMAGTVVQVRRFLADLAIPSTVAVAVTVTFAANPMIALFGANGMSEAPFLFFLVVATRQLTRWIDADETIALGYAGVALAFAYLTRFEAIAAAACAALVVTLVAYRRAPKGMRRLAALSDGMIVILPPLFAFGLWSVISWVIVGSPLEYVTSLYGNSAQVGRAAQDIAASTGTNFTERLGYSVEQLVVLAPSGAAIVGVTIVLSLTRRDARLLAPIGVFGGVLALAVVAFTSGSSFGWLRYYVAAIPLVVLFGGLCLGLAVRNTGTPLAGRWRHVSQRAVPYVTGAALVGLFVISAPVTAAGMFSEDTGRGDSREQLSALVGGERIAAQYYADAYTVSGTVSSYLDSLALPDGSILADSANAFSIILRSNSPRQFVITPDRDFEQILSDPTRFGVKYVLIPRGGMANDAVARALPGLSRGDVAELIEEFNQGAFAWRLYRLH